MKIHDHVPSHHSFMYLWILGALVVLGGLAYSYIGAHPEGVVDAQGEGDVRTVVAAFGNQLNSVSLLSPQAAQDIASAYGPYVTPELLAAWTNEPLTSPGRSTSSPWPDHIEVDSVIANENGSYEVAGRIMLVASTGDAGQIPVSFTVSDIGGSFLISRYQEQGMPEEAIVEPDSANLTAALDESVSAYGVTLTPLTLDEDSRCPSDVQCIQAGRLIVSVRVSDAMGTSTMPFTLGGPAVTTEAADIRLIEATPVRVSTESPDDTAYRFVFHIDAR